MKQFGRLLMTLVPMLAVVGCGGNGASSNDQGVSVTFLGLFQSTTAQSGTGTPSGGSTTNNLTGCGQLPQPLAAGFISLGQTMPQATATPNVSSSTGLLVDPSGAVYAVVGVQNNMYGQFFRADRILLEYYVPGASVQPPSTNVALNLLAGPAEAGTQGGSVVADVTDGIRRPNITSLPPAFNQICNRAFATVPIIPAPIREWLNFNSSQLPETPFDLEIVVTLTGLSSGGNRYDTNQGLFTINVVPEVLVIPPTPAVSVNGDIIGGIVAGGDTEALNARDESLDDSDAQGLDELEAAFDTESVVEGE